VIGPTDEQRAGQAQTRADLDLGGLSSAGAFDGPAEQFGVELLEKGGVGFAGKPVISYITLDEQSPASPDIP
jgi:hypothetical protein